MNQNWAEENLQTIRTLMERSALYRRALAPIMILAGVIGLIATGIGTLIPLETFPSFLVLWFGAAILALLGALLIARRQAIKDKEKIWSSPTRRVVQALTPPLAAGFLFGILPVFFNLPFEIAFPVTLMWVLFYGFALHAAGFFMPRGIKYFGLCFIIAVIGLIYAVVADRIPGLVLEKANPHWIMGFFFGVLHLIYGAYLYLTEKKNPVA